jgi:hypothetical protein
MLESIYLIGLNSMYICSICGILGYTLMKKEIPYNKVKQDNDYMEVIL